MIKTSEQLDHCRESLETHPLGLKTYPICCVRFGLVLVIQVCLLRSTYSLVS